MLKLYFANLLRFLILIPYLLNSTGVMEKMVATPARKTEAQFDPSDSYIGLPMSGKSPPGTALRKDIAANADDAYMVYVSARYPDKVHANSFVANPMGTSAGRVAYYGKVEAGLAVSANHQRPIARLGAATANSSSLSSGWRGRSCLARLWRSLWSWRRGKIPKKMPPPIIKKRREDCGQVRP